MGPAVRATRGLPEMPRASWLSTTTGARSSSPAPSTYACAPSSPFSSPSTSRITRSLRSASGPSDRTVSRITASPTPASAAPGPWGTESMCVASTRVPVGSLPGRVATRLRTYPAEPVPSAARRPIPSVEVTSNPAAASCSARWSWAAVLASDPIGRGSWTSGAAAAAARSALKDSSGAVDGCGAVVPRERSPPTIASSSTRSRIGPAHRGLLLRLGRVGSGMTASCTVLGMGPVYAVRGRQRKVFGRYPPKGGGPGSPPRTGPTMRRNRRRPRLVRTRGGLASSTPPVGQHAPTRRQDSSRSAPGRSPSASAASSSAARKASSEGCSRAPARAAV